MCGHLFPPCCALQSMHRDNFLCQVQNLISHSGQQSGRAPGNLAGCLHPTPLQQTWTRILCLLHLAACPISVPLLIWAMLTHWLTSLCQRQLQGKVSPLQSQKQSPSNLPLHLCHWTEEVVTGATWGDSEATHMPPSLVHVRYFWFDHDKISHPDSPTVWTPFFLPGP